VVYERFASPVISRRAKCLLKHLLEQLQVVHPHFSECYTRLVCSVVFMGASNVLESAIRVFSLLLYICPHTTVCVSSYYCTRLLRTLEAVWASEVESNTRNTATAFRRLRCS